MLSIGNFTRDDEKTLLGKSYHDPLLGIGTASLGDGAVATLKQEKIEDLKKKDFDLNSLEDLLVIVDEAHVAPAFCYYNIISALHPTILYGCTATPGPW